MPKDVEIAGPEAATYDRIISIAQDLMDYCIARNWTEEDIFSAIQAIMMLLHACPGDCVEERRAAQTKIVKNMLSEWQRRPWES